MKENNKIKERRTPDGEAQPKRLYKMEDGALISGVCSGLGVYFNVDPTVIRIIFVIATIITQGIGIVVYIFMMIIIPYAKSPEDFARAHGNRVNPNPTERRQNNSSVVNSKAYWQKFLEEQLIYWREFIMKIFSPLREFFRKKSTK